MRKKSNEKQNQKRHEPEMTLGITGPFPATDSLSLEVALHWNTRLWVHSTETPAATFSLLLSFWADKGLKNYVFYKEITSMFFIKSMHTIV